MMDLSNLSICLTECHICHLTTPHVAMPDGTVIPVWHNWFRLDGESDR